MQRQGLLPARQAEQSKGLKLRAKSDEDQGAYGEDQGADCEVEDQQKKASESKRFGSREGNLVHRMVMRESGPNGL